MNDLFVGLGLVLVIEGLIWALAPHFGLQMLEVAAHTPENRLRTGGAIAVAIGVFIVWLIRG